MYFYGIYISFWYLSFYCFNFVLVGLNISDDLFFDFIIIFLCFSPKSSFSIFKFYLVFSFLSLFYVGTVESASRELYLNSVSVYFECFNYWVF